MEEQHPKNTSEPGVSSKEEKENLNSSTDISLDLSLTPPILGNIDDEKKVLLSVKKEKPNVVKKDLSHPSNISSDESISEHISSDSSTEKDRSFQELEVSNQLPENVSLTLQNLPSDEEIAQVQKGIVPTLNTSENSIINLNVLDQFSALNVDGRSNVRSILEEILNNEQFKSNSEKSINNSAEESLNIFANIDLDDKSLNNYRVSKSNEFNNQISLSNIDNLYDSDLGVPLQNQSDLSCTQVNKRLKDFEELIAIKDTTIAALTSELDSYRDLISNPSTLSLGTSTTEYRQYQEECHNKIVEYHNAIVHKDNLIQQLTESLEQSVLNREDLKNQSENFKDQIVELQKQLEETSKMIKENVAKSTSSMSETSHLNIAPPEEENSILQLNIGIDFSTLETTLDDSQITIFNNIKVVICDYIKNETSQNKLQYQEELKQFKDKLQQENEEHEAEISRLRGILANIKCGSAEIMDLKQELNAKHSKEMEELRTYFEKKCADLEKNYSEEVFSQQSRKMSGSSSGSDIGLSSDLLGPGPGGDSLKYSQNEHHKGKSPSTLSREDIIEVCNELKAILQMLSVYDLETIPEEDLDKVRKELNKTELRPLIMQTGMLHDDFETKIVKIQVEHEEKLRSLEKQYLQEIETLKDQLNQFNTSIQIFPQLSSAIQEVGGSSSGEFEISEVVQSYERRLQEQVTLAKIDIIAALEAQIQVLDLLKRLAANEGEEEEWPSELLQLRDRFTERYEEQIMQMSRAHQEEIAVLKEEHLKHLNGALERARRRSLKDTDSLNRGEIQILKERDNLKKQISALRNLLGELLKYFTQCEDELNNTLVEELLKQGFEKNFPQLEEDPNSSTSVSTKTNDSSNSNVKRVHLAPNFEDLINIIDSSSIDEADSKDISIDLKNELGYCLEKLKVEANAILALTMLHAPKVSNVGLDNEKNMSIDEKVSSLMRQVISETQAKNVLNEQLEESQAIVESLEAERCILENQLEQVIAKQKVVENDLEKAREKISELIENGHKEIVSEGYGADGRVHEEGLSEALAALIDLQDKARNLIAEWSVKTDPNIIHLIEDFSRIAERIAESSKKDLEDLKQQIDVADKKYKTTQKFLEDQAAEREQERDEAQKEIDLLKDMLRDREKDRASCERINSEVEHLEHQISDLRKQLEQGDQNLKEVDGERKEAVEKIYVLRDIIRDLESQVEIKSQSEEELRNLVAELECIVRHQSDPDHDHNTFNDSVNNISDVQVLREHIASLEAETQRLRLNTELVGSEGPLNQIKNQLHEFETTLDKQTKDLEGLTVTATSCSSPSEDMSVRDIVQPQSQSLSIDECEVPLQQLSRIKEKLLRHSRAEDAALKKIRDLEMQLFTLRTELEESQCEKDILKKQTNDQLVLISSLQIRLDDQRIRAEHIEKQTNTSLEVRIYDLQNEIDNLEEKLRNKEKIVNQLNIVVEETRRHLREKEKEINDTKPDEVIVEMQCEIEHLRYENDKLKSRINNEANILPNLVENIISDKNIDIEKLRDKLSETEKQLELYNSLSLDKSQIETLNRLKRSGTTLESIISFLDLSEPEQMRKISDNQTESLSASLNIPFKRNSNETVFLGNSSEPEISKIEKVGKLLNVCGKTNSTEIYKPNDKHVHFEDTDIEKLQNEIFELQSQIAMKDALLKEYTDKLNTLNDIEIKMEKLQEELQKTEDALKLTTENFEKEENDLKESQRNIKVELAEKKINLEEKEKQLEVYIQDSQRKDDMYIKLAKEKKAVENKLVELQDKITHYDGIDNIVSEKNKEIYRLESELAKLSETGSDLQNLEILVKEKENLLNSLQPELDSLKSELSEKNQNLSKIEGKYVELKKRYKTESEKNNKLQKEIDNSALLIEKLQSESTKLKQNIDEKIIEIKSLKKTLKEDEKLIEDYKNEIKKQKDVIIDRECELDILNEDTKRYHDEIANLEERIKKSDNDKLSKKYQKELSDKDLEIGSLKKRGDDLNKEIIHLQDLLNEKEKIINQMSEDSKSLHINLETIQSKMQERGNVIDLGRKLRDEQRKNATLLEEIHSLKAQIMAGSYGRKSNEMTTSMDEITGKVRRELDYSAHLDSSIISAVSDQSLSDENNLDKIKQSLAKEKRINKELSKARDFTLATLQDVERNYENVKTQVDKLQAQLKKEKINLATLQLEDGQLIDQLRIKLDSVLDNEQQFEKILEHEKQQRIQLENQLASLKQATSNSSSSISKTEYKSLPDKEDQLQHILNHLNEENSKLIKEVKFLKQTKNEADSNLKYTKDLLNLRVSEIKSLENRIDAIRESESLLKENILTTKAQLEDRIREVENTRVLIEEIDQDRKELNNHVKILIDKLEKINSEKKGLEENVDLNAPAPDKLLEKIKELNFAVKDNKQMMELISRLTRENKLLEDRIVELQNQNYANMPFDDPFARANYLFSKYLRSESYRKALIWQKGYLISILATYQEHKPTHQRFLANNQPSKKCSKGKSRFKCAGLAVMAVLRMQYMVVRWHSGKRIAKKVNQAHFQSSIGVADNAGAQFHLGQVVSTKHFRTHGLSNPGSKTDSATTHVKDDMPPWSGATPPSKDRRSSAQKSYFNMDRGCVLQEHAPLRAPDLLSSYIERFNQIQERLGLALGSNLST